MAILDLFKKVSEPLGEFGRVASGISSGRAAGRLGEADFNLKSGVAQQDANVQAADANARRRSQAIADALRGQLLQGTNDAKIEGGLPYGVNVPTISGGSRPSNLGNRAALGKTLETQGTQELEHPTEIKPQNFDNLAPSPNGFDKFLNVAGQGSSIIPTISKLAGVFSKAAPAVSAALPSISGSLVPYTAGMTLPGVGGGAAAGTAGTGGLFGGIGATGAATLGIGAAAAGIAYAIKRHQNATKGDRNDFAKDAGFKDIAAFNNYLSTLGPAGQAARTYGENVVGKHNKQQNQQWMAMVQQAINSGRA